MNDERLIEKLAKLLAQAEGTDNEHEAAAFVERAQQLATEHAVDLERARGRQRDRRRRDSEDPLVQERLPIGSSGRRGNRHRVLLYVRIAQVNDVRVNVASNSTFVLGFGHRADLDVVERLWVSLVMQMTTAAQRRLDAGEHRRDGVPALSWRLSFYDGFIAAVGQRLATARERAVSQDAPPTSGQPSAALVLRAKADRVQDFYVEASQARGSWRGSAAGRSGVSGSARRAGEADGRQADLGQDRLDPRRRITA